MIRLFVLLICKYNDFIYISRQKIAVFAIFEDLKDSFVNCCAHIHKKVITFAHKYIKLWDY